MRIIKGEDVSKVSSEYPKTLNVVANDDMAKTLGIDLTSIKDESTEASSEESQTATADSSKTTATTKKLSQSDKKASNAWFDIILTAISQGLLWAIMAIGVFITFRILDIADLSAEGSFPLGAASTAIMIVNGINPLIATIPLH